MNDTVVDEPPPPPAKITAPLALYDEDSEDFPEDIYDKQLQAEQEEENRKKAMRAKVIYSDGDSKIKIKKLINFDFI